MEALKSQLSFLSSSLIDEILQVAIIQDIPKNTQILRQEQYVKVLPIVIKGLVKVPKWLKKFPEFNQLFYAQYDLRFTDLLDTIQHVLVNKMDKRLYDYLKQKAQVTNQDIIKISHGQIANELGTAREVISRVMKKLEIEHKVVQTSGGIKIID